MKSTFKLLGIITLAVLMAFTMFSCGGGGDDPGPYPPGPGPIPPGPGPELPPTIADVQNSLSVDITNFVVESGQEYGVMKGPDNAAAFYYFNKENVSVGGTWETRFTFAEAIDFSEFDLLQFDFAADDRDTLVCSSGGLYTRIISGDDNFDLQNNDLAQAFTHGPLLGYAGTWITLTVPISDFADMTINELGNPGGPEKDDCLDILESVTKIGIRFATNGSPPLSEGAEWPAEGKFYIKNFKLVVKDGIKEKDPSLTITNGPGISFTGDVKIAEADPTFQDWGKVMGPGDVPAYAFFNPLGGDDYATNLEFPFDGVGEKLDMTSADYFCFDMTADYYDDLNMFVGLYPKFRSKSLGWGFVQFVENDQYRALIDALDPEDYDPSAWLTIKVPISAEVTRHPHDPGSLDDPKYTTILEQVVMFMPRLMIAEADRDGDSQPQGVIYFKNFRLEDKNGDPVTGAQYEE
jgi:hypothetical protein